MMIANDSRVARISIGARDQLGSFRRIVSRLQVAEFQINGDRMRERSRSPTPFVFLIANEDFGARARAHATAESGCCTRVHVAIFGNAACRRGPTGPLPSPKGRLLRAGCEGQPFRLLPNVPSPSVASWSPASDKALCFVMDCPRSIQFAVKTIVSLLIAAHR